MIGRLVACLLALVLAACASTPAAVTGPGRFLEWEQLAVEGLPDQRVSIWLPPEYDAYPRRRFPVLYMWDGQNLFDPATTHYGKAWMVQDVLKGMVARGEAEPHIVVGIWSPPGKDRYRVYLPHAVHARIAGPIRASMDDMAGGPIASDAMLRWTAEVLKPRFDREFRTRSGARDTTVVGASMGGLMACYAALERPDIFSRAGCVSAHFALADPELATRHRPAIEAAWSEYLAARFRSADGQRIWLDHGTATLDASYAPWQRHVAARFEAAGWQRDRDFAARVYPGAEHDEIAWHARLPEMLRWLWQKR